jgi:hypothetical protein
MSDTLTEIPVRKAGKRGLRLTGNRGVLHEHTVNLLDVLKDGVTPLEGWHPFDARGKIPAHAWNIDFNDQLGCCGFAAADHGNMAEADNAKISGKLYTPPYGSLEDAYWAYGVQQGEPGPKPDEGVSNDVFVPWLVKNKFAKAAVQVPLQYLSWAASQGHGVLIGVSLDDDAQQDFEHTPQIPWGASNETPDPNEGHDIWLVQAGAWKTDGTAVGEVVTWGWTQPIAYDFVEKNIEDAHLINFRSSKIIDQAKYEAAITALNS